MSFEHIAVEQDDKVLKITLNRPESMNALYTPGHMELDRVFAAFAEAQDQWVAIITGAGDKAFCAGQDLKQLALGNDKGMPPTGFGAITSRFDLNKPVIAAVNGLALGGGLEIALACDIVVASENATFGLPEARVGVAALAGGLHRLPRQIGLKNAMGMILTGRKITAAEAKSLGLVNEVTSQAELMNVAMRWAKEICACSPMSVRASKEAILRGLDTSLPAALSEQGQYPAIRAMFKSEDFKEGPRAFAEKRPPRWKGA